MPSDDRIADDPADDPADAAFEPALKLHSMSWLFVALNYIKQFLLALVAAAVVGSGRDAGLLFPLTVIIPIVAAAVWHQWVFRYGFSERGLVVHEGLFFRNVRTVDYGRIENVDTQRGVLHRLFGVAEVRVETSSGGKPEALIRVLTLPEVETMRERIFGRHADAAEADVAEARSPSHASARERETLLELPPSELVRFGLIDNRGLLVVAAVLGFLAQSGHFQNLASQPPAWVTLLPWDRLFGLGGAAPAALGLIVFTALIVGTRLLSVLLALVTLHGFSLARSGDDLHTRFGLLTRVSLTLRRRRVQAVHQTATWLHRLFRRVSLRVDLAGGTSPGSGQETPGQASQRELWLAPLCTPQMAEQLIRAALPNVRLDGLVWHRLAPRARRRIFRVIGAVWVATSAPLALWLAGPAGAAAAAVAALPLIWLHAVLYVKHTGWALHDEFFVLRRGWLTRKLSVAPRNRIQSVRVIESPFDRRHDMASIEVDNAGAGAVSHRLMLRYLPKHDAERLTEALYRFDANAAAETGAQ